MLSDSKSASQNESEMSKVVPASIRTPKVVGLCYSASARVAKEEEERNVYSVKQDLWYEE